MVIIVAEYLPTRTRIQIKNHISTLIYHIVAPALFEIYDFLLVFKRAEIAMVWGVHLLTLSLHINFKRIMWKLKSQILR